MAVAALTLVSCQKEVNHESIDGDGIEVTLVAGNPITRTVLGEDGETPYWKDGDALSVTNGTSTNVEFTENSIAEGETAAIATFAGKVSAAGDFYAVYPHTGTVTEGKGPRVTIPTEQHPTATSFDGAADIMVSKKFSVNATTSTTIDNLQFARCGAILKIVFSGKASAQQTLLADQHPINVSLTAKEDLVGNVLFDYETGTASIFSTPSKTVSAAYTTSTQYAINGTNATYLVVVPTTLTETLTVAATTENYEISRTLSLPEGGIELEAGKVYTFNVKLGSNSISEATPAQELPWTHEFSWHNSTSETNYTTDIDEKSGGEFVSGSYVYGAKEAGAIRIGNGSNPGSVTSKLLNLSGAFVVTVSAKAYNTSDNSKITVSVGDVTKTAPSTLSSNYVDYEFEFAAGDGTAKSPIVIGTDVKRAIITSVAVATSTPKVEAPTFSPAAGAVEANTTVTISCATEGATIHYTTDGSDPTLESATGTTVTIDAAKTIKAFAVKEGCRDSEIASASYTIIGAAESLPYNNLLLNSHDGFTFNIVSAGGLNSVWYDSSYGLTANGNNCTSSIEAYAESPLIDLSSVADAMLKFSHAVNYFADVATAKTQATLQIREKDKDWQSITIPTYPESLSNSFVSAEINLADYAGKIIQFRFKYIATTSNPGRWQIKNLSVTEVVPPAHEITVNGAVSPLTVVLDGDATKTTKLTISSNYTWSVKSTTGLNTAFTYSKDSDTQITVTPASDNTTGSAKTGIGTMVLTDGTVDFSITFDQANKLGGYFEVDFENESYSDWTFTNCESLQTGSITAHSGTYYGTTGGKASGSIQTKNIVVSPVSLSCYVSKQSTNTTSSTWYIQVSSDGSNWTNVKTQSATSMSKGEWVEFSADLTSYNDVYVRVYYSGSTAVRNIDDLILSFN